ncbi:glycosyltransferase, partial [Acinetobacter baumannii]
MKISVVIPTHRRSELLSRAISSVTAQVRPADEIIIVDDADDSASRMVV